MIWSSIDLPHTGQRDHILGLPVEIRLMIYTFALSNRDGLRYHRDDYGAERLYERKVDAGPVKPYQEANQLQYVSRCFRKECRLLNLLHNKVYFDDYEDTAAFARGLGSSVCKRIEEIYIVNGRPSNNSRNIIKPGFQAIRLFCADNPHIKVRAQLAVMKLEIPDLLSKCLAFSLRARGYVCVSFRVMAALQASQEVLDAYSGRNRAKFYHSMARVSAIPENLRLCPLRSWDEHSFREHVAADTAFTGVQRLPMGLTEGLGEGGVDAFVEVVKEVLEEGL